MDTHATGLSGDVHLDIGIVGYPYIRLAITWQSSTDKLG